MDLSDGSSTEPPQVASSRESDIRQDSASIHTLPTDSMVTVRLSSDASSSSKPNLSSEDQTTAISAAEQLTPAIIPSPDKVKAIEDVKQSGAIRHETESEETMTRRDPQSSSNSFQEDETSTIRSRSESSGSLSSSSGVSAEVDWDELERSEEQAPRDEGSDESTAFLLARLEQENAALATDPKAALARARSTRKNTKGRPPSMQQLRKLVTEPTRPSLRYSLVPEPPPMTELEFWAALVNDYPQTAQRLPTLTSNKIRSGIPPPLRGVVWMSIAGSRDQLLEGEYDRLCGESSPYENLIGKDIGRSFPGVEMFRDPSGDGQQMLGRVLKCFSLYDHKIGYCQGLGFVVGPLLMHMGEKEAFCVLVRLMEHYDLRSCFLPDLSGLHLRIYQFQHLLSKHHPELAAHLESMQVEPLYVSQWFLSFFAVTCPLPMLLRIYDVILTEGASETLMRVALSLMRRNEKKIMACTELEDVMGLLLSRTLWDTYGCDADDLVNNFVGLTGLVTREGLESLESSFRHRDLEDAVVKDGSAPTIQAAASKFLGRFWTGATSMNTPITSKITSPTSSLGVVSTSRPSSFLKRTPSKQSMASTLNSIESLETHVTLSTDATAMSRNPSVVASSAGVSSQDRDLHGQIEDLLMALSDMQREHGLLASELQKEREEREEDRAAVQRFVDSAKTPAVSLEAIAEGETSPTKAAAPSPMAQAPMQILHEHFTPSTNKRSSLMHQTKYQMREDIKLWKDQCEIETTRSADFSRQLADEKAEKARILEQFRDMRTRMQEAHQDKQRLERTLSEYKTRRYSTESEFESIPATPTETPPSAGGLRELRLGRSGSIRSNTAPATSTQAFAKRGSSLGIQTVLATEDHKPPTEDALLLELVAVKTSEAVARQELDEVKAKLESLRKMLSGGPAVPSTSGNTSGHRPSASEAWGVKRPTLDIPKPTPTAAAPSAVGFFSGWGKRTPSNPPAVTISSES